jgi:hypothetical protein
LGKIITRNLRCHSKGPPNRTTPKAVAATTTSAAPEMIFSSAAHSPESRSETHQGRRLVLIPSAHSLRASYSPPFGAITLDFFEEICNDKFKIISIATERTKLRRR